MIVGDLPPANRTTFDKPPTTNPQPSTGNQQPAFGNQQPAPVNLQPATSPTGAFIVQVAAVSSQEIADIELAALKKYGYNVVIRHEPQDQLLHVQMGPYATRKDAETMRQNVLAHGFNAIVK